MNAHQKKIDLRPFQSKADCAREDSLKAHYRSLAIPVVVAAVQQKAAVAPLQPDAR